MCLSSRLFVCRKSTSNKSDLPYVTTSFPLPTVNIEHIPITVHVSLPAFGRVKTLLPLCYTVQNRTPYVQEVQISMESTDSFMFSGNKQVKQLSSLLKLTLRGCSNMRSRLRGRGGGMSENPPKKCDLIFEQPLSLKLAEPHLSHLHNVPARYTFLDQKYLHFSMCR